MPTDNIMTKKFAVIALTDPSDHARAGFPIIVFVAIMTGSIIAPAIALLIAPTPIPLPTEYELGIVIISCNLI